MKSIARVSLCFETFNSHKSGLFLFSQRICKSIDETFLMGYCTSIMCSIFSCTVYQCVGRLYDSINGLDN